MDLQLSGKTLLVTGGSKGIGLACARAFANEGANIVLAGRNEQTLAAAAASLADLDVRVDIIAVDLGEQTERERLADGFPKVDILVNNAGAIPGGDLLSLSMERWLEAWQLKVFGYIHLTQLYLARMREAGAGTIVNVIGDAGRSPRWDYICGATGNAGLIAFTEAVGAKSVDWNVRVFGVNPTATRTDRIVSLSRQRAETALGDAERWEETIAGRPFGRLAEPEEVANLVTALASPTIGYVSGTVVDIDGGFRNKG